MSNTVQVVYQSPAPAMSKQQYSDYTGFSVGRIEGWIKRKLWTKGIEYEVEGRSTVVYRDEADQWLLTRNGRKVSGPAGEALELPSTAQEAFAMTKPYQATRTVVLT